MSLKDRIFDLVFPERKRLRKAARRQTGSGRGRKKYPGRDPDDGADARYFVRHRR